MKHGNPQLALLANMAIDAIRSIVADPNTPPAVRLRAASLILDSAHAANGGGDGGGAKTMQIAKPAPNAAGASLDACAPPATVRLSLRLPPKIGRNDYCPCGSGLKYKKCCLAKIEGRELPPPQISSRLFLAREGPSTAAL